MQQPNETNNTQNITGDEELDNNQDKFILFKLADELYGAALLSIKEVIKLGAIKPVPYMVPHFKGVINLRGQIVSVVDLRLKFGLPVPKSQTGLILIVETPAGVIGTIIDDLVSVEKFNDADIERNPALETRIPVQFFQGIAKQNDRLVNLVDLSGVLSAEDLRQIRKNVA